MTCMRFAELLLYFLLFHKTYSEKPEPVYRAEGNNIEMGYCFGTDYIVVYRSAPEGDQLLGNSSNKNMPNTPPADLQGRTHISDDPNLLGLQISNLTHLDSGIYRRECWKNQTIISHTTQQLTVCKEEIQSELIRENEEDGGAEIFCRNSAIGSEGTSVRWYYEIYPSYEPTLFLDSSVSLKPLAEELTGFVAVRDNGAMLVFNSMLKKTTYFKCLVIKGKSCLSFQNMHPPDDTDSKDIFVSLGDRVVLDCSADDRDRAWETPLGRIDGNSIRDNQMYLSAGDFSLVIPVVLDEHIGEYSCISPLSEKRYLLIRCPNNKVQKNTVHEGESVSLTCNFGQLMDHSESVHWHRYGQSGQYEIIHDSQDENISIPEDLEGRVTVSEYGSSLTIDNLQMKDKGMYGCAAFKSSSWLMNYGNYSDYDVNVTEEDETTSDYQWIDPPECIFKQEIILTILVKEVRTMPNTTTAQSASINTTTVTAAVLVAGLLVVGTIVTVVVVKKKRARASRREVTPQTRIDMEPGCTERLTSSTVNEAS